MESLGVVWRSAYVGHVVPSVVCGERGGTQRAKRGLKRCTLPRRRGGTWLVFLRNMSCVCLCSSVSLSPGLFPSPQAAVHKAKRSIALLTQLCSDVLWVRANEHITPRSIPHKHHIFSLALAASLSAVSFQKRPVLLSSSFRDLFDPLLFSSLSVFNY